MGGEMFQMLLLSLLGATPSHAEGVSKDCSAYQGFQFDPANRAPFGYLLELDIGEHALPADLVVGDPIRPGEQLRVVSVLHEVSWSQQRHDPIRFTGQISGPNRELLQDAMMKRTLRGDTRFQFVVYDYDRQANAYYRAFESYVPLHGELHTHDEEHPYLQVGQVKSGTILEPENYTFHVAISPRGNHEAQLNVGYDRGSHLSYPWGGHAHPDLRVEPREVAAP